MSTSKIPRYTPSPLCLLCSSTINVSPSVSATKTKCCSRYICKHCTESKGRVARWNPCLYCEGSWTSVDRKGEGVLSDDPTNQFVLGDDDDDDDEEEDSEREVEKVDAEDETDDQLKVAKEKGRAEDDSPSDGQIIRHIIQKGDTLIGISLKYGVDPHHLCTLNKLPPSTIHTTPHLLQTRSYLLLLPSPPPSLPASTLSQLAHERALARFAKITKEEDPLVRRAYVGVAEIDREFGVEPESYEDKTEKSETGTAKTRGDQETVEGRAVGRFFEDLEWEGEQRADHMQVPRGFPVQSGSGSGLKWRAAGPEGSGSSSGSKKSWWKGWGFQSEENGKTIGTVKAG